MWMLAAAGILVPLVIHLWNIREGKTLKIGSVALLVESSRQRARSLQLRDILLLLLRCLVILLLASLLAGPFRTSTPPESQQKGWIVLDKETAAQAYRHFRPQIDSLIAAGMQVRYFEKEFTRLNKAELAALKDTIHTNDTVSYWGLLRPLQKQVPVTLPVYLYTPNRLNAFRGPRPQLSLQLHWQTFTTADSSHRRLAGAQLAAADSIRILEAVSSPDALQYQVRTVSATRPAAAGYQVRFDQGRMLLAPSDTGALDQTAVEIDTATKRMIIYTDTFVADANYLQAALRAIGQYAQRRMEIKRVGVPTQITGRPDWIFWLSDKPLPPSVKADHVLRYQAGNPKPVRSWIVEADRQSNAEPVSVYKLVADSSATSFQVALWQDGFGNPLLTKSDQGTGHLYRLYTHFNPQWNDLPWSNRFPVWLMRLLEENDHNKDWVRQDTRRIDPQQSEPEIIKTAASGTTLLAGERTDLAKPLWIAAFLILLLERILTFRKKTEKPS